MTVNAFNLPKDKENPVTLSCSMESTASAEQCVNEMLAVALHLESIHYTIEDLVLAPFTLSADKNTYLLPPKSYVDSLKKAIGDLALETMKLEDLSERKKRLNFIFAMEIMSRDDLNQLKRTIPITPRLQEGRDESPYVFVSGLAIAQKEDKALGKDNPYYKLHDFLCHGHFLDGEKDAKLKHFGQLLTYTMLAMVEGANLAKARRKIDPIKLEDQPMFPLFTLFPTLNIPTKYHTLYGELFSNATSEQEFVDYFINYLSWAIRQGFWINATTLDYVGSPERTSEKVFETFIREWREKSGKLQLSHSSSSSSSSGSSPGHSPAK